MENKPLIKSAEHRAAICAALGVSPQAVSNWNARGFPTEHCAIIEKVTNYEITRQYLRPDDWHLIWPELIGADGAPSVEAKAA